MKITIKKSDILDVLSKIQGMTNRKSSLAITSCVLLRATEQGIVMTATDLETAFEGEFSAEVEEGGAVALNSRKLFEIVREFPRDDIRIFEEENRWITIGNGNVEYHLVGMDPEDFPEIPVIDDVPFFSINSAAFRQMVEKTLLIGPTDDKRAHILGVFIDSVPAEEIPPDTPPMVRLVATDGSRLSKVDYPVEEGSTLALESGILVPKKALNEVGKFLESIGNVDLGFKNSHFIVKKPTETLIVRLLEGEFPNYQGLVKKPEVDPIVLDKAEFQMMVRRMSILSTDTYKGVIFDFSDQRLLINSTNPDIGESKEEMAIDYSGEAISVAFNPRFFLDAISQIDGEKVFLTLVNEDRPCIIDGFEDAHHFITVIMPMKI